MEYAIPLCIAVDELKGAAEVADAIRHDLSPSIVAAWPGIRTALEGARVARVGELSEKIGKSNQGLVDRLDALMADAEQRRKTSGVEPLIKWGDPVGPLLWDLMYWKYSIDHRGRGNGASQRTFDTLIGSRSPFPAATFAPISTDWPCPHCGGEARVSAHCLSVVLDDFRHELALKCARCGHVERQHREVKRASALTCTCSWCKERRTKAAAGWGALAQKAWIAVASDIAEKISSAAKTLTMLSDKVSEDGMRFTRMLWEHPDKHIGQLARDYYCETEKTTYAHPYHVSKAFWSIAPGLVQAGVLECTPELTVNLNDPHAIVERAFQSRVHRRDEDAERHRLANALTVAMGGPTSSAPEKLTAWVSAVCESGVVDGWLELPCNFWFGVNRDRVHELCNSGSSNASSDLYLYRCQTHETFRRALEPTVDRVLDIASRLRTAPLLEKDTSGLLEHVRMEVAPLMARRARKELDAHPEVVAILKDIETAAKTNSNERPALPAGVNLWRDEGKALANYLYWTICREAVGEANGVALAWVMKVFGCQAAQFRKLIWPATGTIQCPMCSAAADVTDIVLSHPHAIGKATLRCSSCRHVEKIGGSNQLVCECTACHEARRAGLAEAKEAGTGIVGRVIERYLDELGRPKEKTAFDWGSREASREDLLAYAQLRQAGYSPERCASLLVSGTIFEGKHGFWSPLWLATFTKSGVFKEGPIEKLEGEAARNFVAAELMGLLDEKTEKRGPGSLQAIEAALCSEDAYKFSDGVECLRIISAGGIALPMRKRCEEVPGTLSALAEEAERVGVDATTVQRRRWGMEPPVPRSALLRVPPWNGTSTITEMPVDAATAAADAARKSAIGDRPRSKAYLAGVEAEYDELANQAFVPNPHGEGTAEHDAFAAGRDAVREAWRKKKGLES